MFTIGELEDPLGLATEIVGVQSAHAPAHARSLQAGEPVAIPSADTRADGLAVRVPDPEALPIIRSGVARIVIVIDAKVAEAVRAYRSDPHNLAEGADAPHSPPPCRSAASWPGGGSASC